MLRWFFNKKEEENENYLKDFSVFSTDVHSHLIPGIDDGAPDLETSLYILKKLRDLGYKKIVTTPHVMSDLYKNDSDIIKNGLKLLTKALKEHNINISVSAAAEYYIDFSFVQKIGKENFLTFGDRYILVEHSFNEPPKDLFNIIFKLQLEGYKVVLAHPERYRFYDMNDYEELIKKGVYLQINLLSLTDYYSNSVCKKVEEMINRRMVSFVGTDCHNKQQTLLYTKCLHTSLFYDLINKNVLLNHTL